ncbi:MAG: hypothetical protein K2G77_09555, partial [Muribaculaceae bacterium]|nr:hypothetical protein [Muribaculaceae bacterium]
IPIARTHMLAVGVINIYSQGIYLFASFLTKIEIYQISESQERASSKRFSIMSAKPAPHYPLPGFRSAVCDYKIIIFIRNMQIKV